MAANWMQNVGSAISRAVEDVTKPGKVAKASASAGNSRAAPENSHGLTEGGRRNVHDILKAGMMAVAEKVELRFTKVEADTEDIKVSCARLEARVAETERLLEKQKAEHDELKQDVVDGNANFERRIANVESMCAVFEDKFKQQSDTVDKLLTPNRGWSTGAGSSQGAPAGMANANSDDTPYHLRVLAKIGGFVYDTDAEVMLTQCRMQLTDAGVHESTYKHLHCPRTKGSWCLLTFDTPANLARARLAFQARKIVHGGRRIWLDAAKTRAELLPSRLVHRAHTCVSSSEEERADGKLVLEKDMRGKQLKAGRHVLGYSLRGEWKWTSFSEDRYSKETLEVLTGWIMAD